MQKIEFTGGFTRKWGKPGLFAAGVLFGTAGIKILSSKDAKKVYTHTTAAALRAKDSVMTTVTVIRENAGDILADARQSTSAARHRMLPRSLRMRQRLQRHEHAA